MVIDDPTVSRRHARLTEREDRWEIVDLKSTNGIAANGRRVDAAVVREGDEIVLRGNDDRAGPR
jgi:pSer/pThr/pTyr-binding forkhead associated (FHA) protein